MGLRCVRKEAEGRDAGGESEFLSSKWLSKCLCFPFRGFLCPLLHLLLQLWNPSVLSGGGSGPVQQPGERYCLEEDLSPPPR